jgi:ribonuclease BN (tRNA processing enzyme)
MKGKDLSYIFYGCRGSYPVSHPRFIRYGGNTSSLLIEKGEKPVIFDAGTGIINIGKYLLEKPAIHSLDIFLTHLHIDHIQGLPFFQPVFQSNYHINIYCPRYRDYSLKKTIFTLFNHPFSPISKEGIKADLNFFELYQSNGKISLQDGLEVAHIKEDSHPVSGVLIYRLLDNDKSLVYATDVESPEGFSEKVAEFIDGSDVLIHDSQYFDEEYYCSNHSRKGYGHSTSMMAVENAIRCRVKKLFLFHYDPSYSDQDLERMLKEARVKFKNTFLSEEMKQNKLRSQ